MVAKKRKPIIKWCKSTITGLCTHFGRCLQCTAQKDCNPPPESYNFAAAGKSEAAGLSTRTIQEILCVFTSFLQVLISLQTVVGFVCFGFF